MWPFLFWSSVVLTGDPTTKWTEWHQLMFWSSVVLTGDPTPYGKGIYVAGFWSSVVLTGDPTQQCLVESTHSVLEQCRPDW